MAITNSKYLPSNDLSTAKDVAAFLKRPLLLAGEPGTGKTTYAKHLAITEKKDLFTFNTKSISLAQDLFYTYDAVGHFANNKKSAVEFITLEALGKSIVNAYGKTKVEGMLLDESTSNYQLKLLQQSPDRAQILERFFQGCGGNGSIVLVDEIDKAPRDFPNDILNEIDNYEFYIKEIGLHVSLNTNNEGKDKADIFVLITSNFDKNLPDAFLRRCLFHEIEFPKDTELMKIIKSHLPAIDDDLLKQRTNEFFLIRKKEGITKPPSTSEFIDCLKWLVSSDSLNKQLQDNRAALATLLKKKSDLNLYKDRASA